MMERKIARRALLSVSDKRGLTDLAAGLHQLGVALVATSSTASAIEAAGIPVQEVSSVTGFPEILAGRVKTLHPKIHGGVLVPQDDEGALREIADLDIEPFDLVVANLYPFEDAVAGGCETAQCVEMIDIGGPTLLRAAAKNFAHVATVTNPDQYEGVLAELGLGGTTKAFRLNLAREAFQMTAEYDINVSSWFQTQGDERPRFPAWMGSAYVQDRTLRYGENPHQDAAVYRQVAPGPAVEDGLVGAKILGGKPLSFNNLRDSAAAWRTANGFAGPTVAIIKHANPCGLATAESLSEAYVKALACDPLSAFGGIVAANRQVDGKTAQKIAKVFTEVVIAPSYTEEALEVLRQKKALRILEADATLQPEEAHLVPGGMMLQDADAPDQDVSDEGSDDVVPLDVGDDWQLVAGPAATEAQMKDLRFAWNAVRCVKSNAILLAKDEATVGIGMGQVNRLDAARLAVTRADTLGDGDRSKGAVGASDAFFPFPDGLEVLIEAGVAAVVAPGGSKGDPAVIEAANKANLTLYFASKRHFWH